MNKEDKYKPNELKQYILAALGIGLVLGGSVFLTPNFPIVLGGILKMIEEIKGIKIPRKKATRVLKQLERNKLIRIERKGDELYVTVKNKDDVSMLKYSLREVLNLKKKKEWQGKWFLVVFDIPEEERIKRNYLRSFLREIGFYSYNQSVYVFPYECEKEISLVKKIVEGGKYISYIIAERLEREDNLKIYFGLDKT
jgi:CRISPR-associated endonuclease Cas2